MTDTVETGTLRFIPGHSEPIRRYPWYDSEWLQKYLKAKAIIQVTRPDALSSFVDAFRVLRTRPGFEVKPFDRVFNDEVMAEVRRVAASLRPTDLEMHELRSFGRFVAHGNPYFTDLQRQIAPVVSEAVGEAIEVSYNFLSLYRAPFGVCHVHMDAPNAKWTLDICLNQSAQWPIYFSPVQPWPEENSRMMSCDDWENQIKQSPSLQFTPHTLQPGQAVLFSGSSQWHYRDAIPPASGRQFCDLLFFHFIPKGTSELVRPRNWARLFGIPELNQLG
jgi:hypothetical protein